MPTRRKNPTDVKEEANLPVIEPVQQLYSAPKPPSANLTEQQLERWAEQLQKLERLQEQLKSGTLDGGQPPSDSPDANTATTTNASIIGNIFGFFNPLTAINAMSTTNTTHAALTSPKTTLAGIGAGLPVLIMGIVDIISGNPSGWARVFEGGGMIILGLLAKDGTQRGNQNP